MLVGGWHSVNKDPANESYTLFEDYNFMINILDCTIDGKWELKDSTVIGIGWEIIEMNQDTIITPRDTLIRMREKK